MCQNRHNWTCSNNMYMQNFVGVIQAKPPVFTYVFGHGFVAKRKRLLAKICRRVIRQLNNGSFSSRERFKYVCDRTINMAVVDMADKIIGDHPCL